MNAAQTEGRLTQKLRSQLKRFLQPEPKDSTELLSVLNTAQTNGVIDPDSRSMIEGVMKLADLTVADIMVPATKMDMLDIDLPQEEMLAKVIEHAHSRFPVFANEREHILGILLAKDLLKLQRAPELSLKALLRPAVFVPESKGLNDLLRAFRDTRNHLALVVDEFGQMAGLVTIEDVLEEIVGEIEDEFDSEAEHSGIYTMANNTFRVDGDTRIENAEKAFEMTWPVMDEMFDTVGGYIAHQLGHVPRRGEFLSIGGWKFEAMHARAGKVKWFRACKVNNL